MPTSFWRVHSRHKWKIQIVWLLILRTASTIQRLWYLDIHRDADLTKLRILFVLLHWIRWTVDVSLRFYTFVHTTKCSIQSSNFQGKTASTCQQVSRRTLVCLQGALIRMSLHQPAGAHEPLCLLLNLYGMQSTLIVCQVASAMHYDLVKTVAHLTDFLHK